MNNHLFDALKDRHSIPLDKTLAYSIGIYPTDLWKIRAEKSVIGATLILRIHETFDMPVSDIRRLISIGR